MRTVKNITQGNIYKNYLLFAAPLIFSSILGSLYSTVDAMIAGKFISEHALGAISATHPFDILFNSFFNGFTSGFSIYIAHLFGKKDYSGIKRNVVNMSIFVAVVSVIISILAIFFRATILDYLNIDPLLRKDAEIYFVIYTSSYLISFVNMILLRTLYALGTTSVSLLVSVMSAVVNIVGNLVTVLVFDWGIAGLAFSTVLSVIIATVIYLYMIAKAFRELRCEKASYRFSLALVKDSLSYTLPTAIQKMAFHATGILIAPSLNSLGADATTGYSVMSRMYNFCGQSFWNMSSAVDCHTAQAAGSGNISKVRRGLFAGLWMNIAATTPFVLLFAIFAKPIASIFFPSGYQGPALEYAVRFFEIFFVFLYVNMIGHLMHSYMRSIGRVTTVFWITVFGSSVQVAVTLLLVPFFKMDGVYLGLVSAWVADGTLSVILYFALYHSKEKLQKILDSIFHK